MVIGVDGVPPGCGKQHCTTSQPSEARGHGDEFPLASHLSAIPFREAKSLMEVGHDHNTVSHALSGHDAFQAIELDHMLVDALCLIRIGGLLPFFVSAYSSAVNPIIASEAVGPPYVVPCVGHNENDGP